MFSSMVTYSSPFCKKVISAPGGKSVSAMLDFVTNDSDANVNELWVKPVMINIMNIKKSISKT